MSKNAQGELVTSWGWGRPFVPSFETPHYRLVYWTVIYLVVALFAYGCCGLVLGDKGHPLAWLLLFPLFAALAIFPALCLVLIPWSWAVALLKGGNKGCPEAFWKFNDKEFENKWKGKKIPLRTLYEAYFDGLVDLAVDAETGKPRDLLSVLYHRHSFSLMAIEWEHVKFFLLKLIPELLWHSQQQDTDQVREHYDRGDDFYAAFLGPSMTYTSGVWTDNEDASLEEAQRNKMELIAQKIHLKAGEQHLDYGCGWGTFISHCAKNYGTDSTGITLAKNQTEWANRVAKEAAVGEKARALCMDYRDAPSATENKKFDKITCLEMSEHVGVLRYSRFCRQIYEQLKDDGIYYLQIAGLRRPFMFEDLLWGMFMGKYVFPGADASCPLGWVVNQLEAAGFEVHSVENIGIHYSATIKRWYDNWNKPENVEFIGKKYGKRAQREWNWFLAWSVISPEQGSATCFQIVSHKNLVQFDRKGFVGERKHWKI